MARWVVETRRDARGRGPTARSVAQGTPGVVLVDRANPDRVVVEASHEAARRMAEDKGETIAVERADPGLGTVARPAGRGGRTEVPRSSGAARSRGGHVPCMRRG